MSTLIDNGTFTFSTEEITDFSSVIKTLVFSNPAITDLHDIEVGITHNKQIVFASKLGLLSKQKVGCVPNSASGITLTQKKWEPVLYDFRLAHCQTDVNFQDKLVNQWTKVSNDYHNVVEGSGSATGDFLVGIVQESMPEDILVKVWFSDKSASVFPTGNFTIGTDLGFLNASNGLFKQIFTEIPTPQYAIPKNAGTTYATQTLEVGDAHKILKGIYNPADSRLLELADKQFYVTRSVYDAFLNDKEDKEFNAGIQEIVENGIPSLTYRGIKVTKIDFWDRYIQSMQNNGTKLFRPHRAILTTKSNIPIGTPDIESLTSLNAFFDNVTKQNYIDAEYGLDAKLLQTHLISVAY
jgi:hypothetical protein